MQSEISSHVPSHVEYPHPYTRCLGGKGQIYIQDCLIPLAHRFGNAEFSFCDMESVLSGGCLTARKMFSRMKDAGFIVKLPSDTKSSRYALHPVVFRIVDEHLPPIPHTSSGLPLAQCITPPARILL
jgi:hypothetical protein